MKIKLVAYGIAKDIVGSKQMEIELNTGDSISNLRQLLIHRYADFAKLQSLNFAVGINYQDDSFCLSENDEVVIIPPVSGG